MKNYTLGYLFSRVLLLGAGVLFLAGLSTAAILFWSYNGQIAYIEQSAHVDVSDAIAMAGTARGEANAVLLERGLSIERVGVFEPETAVTLIRNHEDAKLLNEQLSTSWAAVAEPKIRLLKLVDDDIDALQSQLDAAVQAANARSAAATPTATPAPTPSTVTRSAKAKPQGLFESAASVPERLDVLEKAHGTFSALLLETQKPTNQGIINHAITQINDLQTFVESQSQQLKVDDTPANSSSIQNPEKAISRAERVLEYLRAVKADIGTAVAEEWAVNASLDRINDALKGFSTPYDEAQQKIAGLRATQLLQTAGSILAGALLALLVGAASDAVRAILDSASILFQMQNPPLAPFDDPPLE